MTSKQEKGGGTFTGIKLLLCENPLPPLDVIVNRNNPNGGTFDMSPPPDLLRQHPRTRFLVDEAFIGLAGETVAHLVCDSANLLVTRTLSNPPARRAG